MEIQKKIGEDIVLSLNGQPLVTIKDAPKQEEPDPKPETGKIAYSVTSSGVSFAGVGLSSKNLVIMDNDFATDSPEFPLLFLAADKGQINLAGCIMHSTHDPNWNFERTQGHWSNVMNQVKSLKNIPQPVKGSAKKLTRPSNGSIDSTQFEQSAGVDLIISTAKKCTPEKPLVIFMGGQSSTVASAYLKDKSIVDRVILFHINGYWDGGVDGYNTADDWGTYILIKRMKYVCVNVKFPENRKYWYDGKDLGLDQSLINTIPSHVTKNMLNTWFNDAYKREGLADSPAVLWYFNPKVWTSVQRKKENGSVVTSNDYDFLFINGHNWPLYGSTLVNEFTKLLSSEPPVVTDPGTSDPGPVIPPPTGGITSGFEEAIRTAAAGKTIRFVDVKGKRIDFNNITIPRGVSIDLGGAIISAKQPGDWNSQQGVFNVENGIDQTISNGQFDGNNIAANLLVGTNMERVIFDNIVARNSKFTGIWVRGGKNGAIKNFHAHNCSTVPRKEANNWASGNVAYENLESYEVSDGVCTSDIPNGGYGFKALYPKKKLKNVKFFRLNTRMHLESWWNNGQSKNIGFEIEGSTIEGTVEIFDCVFDNQVSLAIGEGSKSGKVIVRDNRGTLNGSTYFLELVGSNFEVYRNKPKGVGIFIANFQKNGVWSNWNIYDNEMVEPAPTPVWGGIILVGHDGVTNCRLGPNKFPAGRTLIHYMDKRGGFQLVEPNQ